MEIPVLNQSPVTFKDRTERWFFLEDFDGEVWVDFPSFDGAESFSNGYMISNYGRLKAKENGRRNAFYKGASHICHTGLNRCGYEVVRLTYMGVSKTITIHKLVALAFLENPNKYKEINHKNEIKTDNRAENLEWCSRSYNMKYGNGVNEGKKKMLKSAYFLGLIKPVNKYNMDGTYLCTYNSVADAARDIGKPGQTSAISNCCKGKHKYAYGYKWKYAKSN